MARLRAWWNRHTHWGEVCHDCGRRVVDSTGSWWSADDALWERVVGDDSTILCPRCFTSRAQAKGVFVFYAAQVSL